MDEQNAVQPHIHYFCNMPISPASSDTDSYEGYSSESEDDNEIDPTLKQLPQCERDHADPAAMVSFCVSKSNLGWPQELDIGVRLGLNARFSEGHENLVASLREQANRLEAWLAAERSVDEGLDPVLRTRNAELRWKLTSSIPVGLNTKSQEHRNR